MNTITATGRPSPDVSQMFRYTDNQGATWAFTDKAKMRDFKRKSRGTKAQRHFLSDRELISYMLHNEIK
jgi:hypothetical protein